MSASPRRRASVAGRRTCGYCPPTAGPAAPDDLLTIGDRDQLDRGFRRLPPATTGDPRAPSLHGLRPNNRRDTRHPAWHARSRLHHAHRAMAGRPRGGRGTAVRTGRDGMTTRHRNASLTTGSRRVVGPYWMIPHRRRSHVNRSYPPGASTGRRRPTGQGRSSLLAVRESQSSATTFFGTIERRRRARTSASPTGAAPGDTTATPAPSQVRAGPCPTAC